MPMEEKEFEQLVRGMRERMYRTAMSILWNDSDSADAIQEALLKAWQRRGLLRDETKKEAWVMRILINECRDMQRQMKRRPLPLDERMEAAQPPVKDTELRSALQALPERLRLPLILHHLHGYDLREVAAMLHTTEPTVRGRIYQARKKLKALLDEEVM